MTCKANSLCSWVVWFSSFAAGFSCSSNLSRPNPLLLRVHHNNRNDRPSRQFLRLPIGGDDGETGGDGGERTRPPPSIGATAGKATQIRRRRQLPQTEGCWLSDLHWRTTASIEDSPCQDHLPLVHCLPCPGKSGAELRNFSDLRAKTATGLCHMVPSTHCTDEHISPDTYPH